MLTDDDTKIRDILLFWASAEERGNRSEHEDNEAGQGSQRTFFGPRQVPSLSLEGQGLAPLIIKWTVAKMLNLTGPLIPISRISFRLLRLGTL